MELRIGHLSTFYHTALLLQVTGDADKRSGASIQWRLFGTGPAIVEAISRGELDLAYIGLPPAIIGVARGADIVCVAGGHMEGTVLAGKPHWREAKRAADLEDVLRQFRGRVIGVPGTGSIHDVILREYLARFGLAGDVAVRNFPWADLLLEALVRDEVAAAVGTPALAAAVKRFASGKLLCPAALLWPNNPSYGIIVSRGYLSAGRETVVRFLEAHEEAEAVIRTKTREAAAAIARHVSIVDAELVLDALRISPRYCAALTDTYIAESLAFVKTLRGLGYINRGPTRDELFDVSLMEAVHPGRDHYGDGLGEE